MTDLHHLCNNWAFIVACLTFVALMIVALLALRVHGENKVANAAAANAVADARDRRGQQDQAERQRELGQLKGRWAALERQVQLMARAALGYTEQFRAMVASKEQAKHAYLGAIGKIAQGNDFDNFSADRWDAIQEEAIGSVPQLGYAILPLASAVSPPPVIPPASAPVQTQIVPPAVPPRSPQGNGGMLAPAQVPPPTPPPAPRVEDDRREPRPASVGQLDLIFRILTEDLGLSERDAKARMVKELGPDPAKVMSYAASHMITRVRGERNARVPAPAPVAPAPKAEPKPAEEPKGDKPATSTRRAHEKREREAKAEEKAANKAKDQPKGDDKKPEGETKVEAKPEPAAEPTKPAEPEKKE